MGEDLGQQEDRALNLDIILRSDRDFRKGGDYLTGKDIAISVSHVASLRQGDACIAPYVGSQRP